MGRPVYRRQMITVAQGSLMRIEDLGIVCLTNPATGQPLTITHVDSDATGDDPMAAEGTWKNPFNLLPGTQPTDTVYLHSDSVFDMQSYNLGDNQRLLGEGGGFVHMVDTVEFGMLALLAGNGGMAKPILSNSAGVGVILGNNSEVANLSIVNPAASGISAAMIDGSLINNVMISGGDGSFGISLAGNMNLIFQDVTLSLGDNSFGLSMAGNTNVIFQNTTISTGDNSFAISMAGNTNVSFLDVVMNTGINSLGISMAGNDFVSGNISGTSGAGSTRCSAAGNTNTTLLVDGILCN